MAHPEILRLEGVKKHFPVTKGLMLARQIGQVHAVDGIDSGHCREPDPGPRR